MIPSDLSAAVESVAQSLPPSAQQDFRNLMNGMGNQIVSISPGQQWLKAGGVKANSSAAPTGVSIQVSGSNGAYTLALKSSNPSSSTTNLLFEVSYSTVKGFTSGVTTLEPSSATSVTLNLPNSTYYFRARATYDRVNFSPYAMASTAPISSGLVSSAATSAAGAFNQTNYLNVDTAYTGSTVNLNVYGTGGPLTNGTSVKGATQSLRPSATFVNVAPGSDQFVGWDTSTSMPQYILRPTLATLLNDNVEPVGYASVVAAVAPSLPVVQALAGTGGAIIGYNVIHGGNGATEDYVLTVTDPGGPGTGATTGAQVIQGGVLISVGPGNPGANYDVHTVVTATGGRGGGIGGGTLLGGNGGRLTAV